MELSLKLLAYLALAVVYKFEKPEIIFSTSFTKAERKLYLVLYFGYDNSYLYVNNT